MAEAFSIAAGAVSIAAAFTACVDCFEYVHLGRNLQRDHQTDQLSLSLVKLRLTRWGQAVNVLHDPNLGRPDATAAELDAVKASLHQILVLFADSEKVSRKYTPAPSVDKASSQSTDVAVLNNTIARLAAKREKGPGVLRTVAWALHGRGELKELVENVTGLIERVEQIFPAPDARRELAGQEAAGIQDRRSLELLEKTSRGVDDLLCAAARDALEGHQYSNMMIEGKAQVGDSFASDWAGRAIGASHAYDGVRVGGGGKALIGNKYGGKDFWDD